MTHKTQPTAHAEITAPISADLRQIGDAGAQPAPITYMAEDRACKWAWDQVREDVGAEGWTTSESCNFYGFFMRGWIYRGQYETQRLAAPPAPRWDEFHGDPEKRAQLVIRLENVNQGEQWHATSNHSGCIVVSQSTAQEALRLALIGAGQAAPPAPAAVAVPDEQYQARMAAISTAAIGYWKEGDAIHPDYDTVALRDVAKLYVKYSLLFNTLAAAPAQAVAVPAEVELPDVEDMAHSAVQEALSYGVSHDVFHRWMRSVMDKTVQALAAAPAQEHATQLAGQRQRTPGSFVNAAGIHASDKPGTVVRKLNAAFHDAVTFADTPAQAQGVRPGFALVPLRLTRAMDQVLQEEAWQWADLLAAANALTEADYDALSRDDLTDTEVFAVADPLFAHQQIGGRVPSQDLDGFRELIGSALSDAVFQAAALTQAQEDARDLEAPGVDALTALLAIHADMLETNPYAYFELAYTRQTGWMLWITDKPGWCKEVMVNPDRKLLYRGQGSTPDEACTDAIAESVVEVIEARAAPGGAT